MLRLSLRSKTIFGVAAIEGILLIAMVLSAIHFFTKTANSDLQKRANTTAKLFATMAEDAVLSYDLASLNTFVNEIMENPDIRYARVINTQGAIFAQAGNKEDLQKLFSADSDLESVDDGIYDTFALIEEGPDVYARVEVGIGITGLNENLLTIKKWLSMLAATEMLLVALFSYLLGSYLTGQLSLLTAAANKVKRAIGSGNFSHTKVEITSKDEISEVALNFNLLIDELQAKAKQTKAYQAELKSLNQSLEQKVEQRTAELVAKHKQLQRVNINLKETQQQLVQNEKLVSMGQLAAGLAHEVNNPIGFVCSNLETLKNYVGTYDQLLILINQAMSAEDETVKNKLQTDIQSIIIDQDMQFVSEDMDVLLSDMEEGLQRVTDIVQNMSVFARVDSDHKQLFDINDCIRSTYKMVEKQVSEKAEIRLELSDLPHIEINVGKINQVFTNLIINAAQAIESNKQGVILVSSRVVDKQILIYVSDTGCGIEPSALKKVFDPFYTTKKEGEGTGLGLAISYDIIKEHNGDLAVSSDLGNGSQFTITLPLTNALLH